jgi:hypothetical protein
LRRFGRIELQSGSRSDSASMRRAEADPRSGGSRWWWNWWWNGGFLLGGLVIGAGAGAFLLLPVGRHDDQY